MTIGLVKISDRETYIAPTRVDFLPTLFLKVNPMQNRITNENSNHRLPKATSEWKVNPQNFLVSTTRCMMEFLIAPGTSRLREDHRREQSVREKFIADFKADPAWTRHANLQARLTAAKAELVNARLDQEAAELQYTSAISGDDESEISVERGTMERYQAAAGKLTAEIKALGPAVAESYGQCRELFNAMWRDAEIERHTIAKAAVATVLAKIDAAIGPLLDELKSVVEVPEARSQTALLDPALSALGPAPSLDDAPVLESTPPQMGANHMPSHPLAFSQ